VSGFECFETELRAKTSFDSAVIGFQLIIKIFHLPVINGVGKQLRFFKFRIASPYAGFRSVLITQGP
jgi:hypothetical protein